MQKWSTQARHASFLRIFRQIKLHPHVTFSIDLRNGLRSRRRQIFILLFTGSSSADIAATLLRFNINIRPSGVPLKFASSRAPLALENLFHIFALSIVEDSAFEQATVPSQAVPSLWPRYRVSEEFQWMVNLVYFGLLTAFDPIW